MRSIKLTVLTAAFFCACGWVCADQALGQNAAADSAGSDRNAKTAGLFDDAPSTSASQATLPQSQSISVGSMGLIDLHVKDLEITQVLQLLSIQSQRNIVASRSVAGSLTADLYGVDFYEALDALLHTNGYGYREKGNFIYVYTADEIKTMEEANRKLAHRLVRLNYIPAADASTFVQPLLSPAGSIAVSGAVTAGIQPTISDAGANSYAHPDTLIIKDYPENVDQIVAVIQQLDVRPKQVLIEATVLNSNLDEDNAFGVDLTVIADFSFQQFTGGPGNVINSLITGAVNDVGQAFQTSVGDTNTRFGSRVGIVGDNIAAFIKALDQVTDTTIISHPKLLVLNRQRAELLIGRRLGYISTTATETSTTQSVEFLDVGTQLTVRPFVSEDGFVRLELKPQISDGTTTTTNGFVIPEQTTQELTTNVMVRAGQTVVLGGLFKEDTVVSRKQVPVVGDIPLLGMAFQGRDNAVKRSEVIFLITPTVIRDEALYAAGDQLSDSVEEARLGARQGLLPFSRSRMTTSHLQAARKALAENKTGSAKFWVNMALEQDPNYVEARRLKERLTGQSEQGETRSLLKEAVDNAVKVQLQQSLATPSPVDAAAQASTSNSAPAPSPAAAKPVTTAQAAATAATQPQAPAPSENQPVAKTVPTPAPSADETPKTTAMATGSGPVEVAPADVTIAPAAAVPAGDNPEPFKNVLHAISKWMPPAPAAADPDAASAAVEVKPQP